MMKIRYIMTMVAACSLAACQSGSVSEPSVSPQAVNAQNVPSKEQRFECQNGMTAVVKYLGHDTISLAVDTIGAQTQLTQAVSGSGERFVNDKGFYNKATEWHQKSSLGHLTFSDPYDNVVEVSCSAK